MWPRVVELMMGCWLILSMFVFGNYPEERFVWIVDLASGAAVIGVVLVSFWRRIEKIHLLNFLIGAVLIGVGFMADVHLTGEGAGPAPAIQNYVVVGLLLMMFSILPSRATSPPDGWVEFYQKKEAARLDRLPRQTDPETPIS